MNELKSPLRNVFFFLLNFNLVHTINKGVLLRQMCCAYISQTKRDRSAECRKSGRERASERWSEASNTKLLLPHPQHNLLDLKSRTS